MNAATATLVTNSGVSLTLRIATLVGMLLLNTALYLVAFGS